MKNLIEKENRKMAQRKPPVQESIAYFFFKSKDVNVENGLSSITLFARLTCEVTCIIGRKKQAQIETVWVQANDVRMEQATEKVKAAPNCIEKYEVSETIFQHLVQLSR